MSILIICFDCFEFWVLHIQQHREIARWFAKLIYLWKISTRFRAMIFLMNYSLQIILSWTINCSSIVRCMIKKVMKLCCVRDFLRSFAHFMFYFPIVCYEIHVKLTHISARWIETIAYRVILNEMLVCTFSIHVRMFRFCQDVCSDNLWSYAHVKIWRDVIDVCFVVWLFSYASVWTSCFAIDLYLVFNLYITCENIKKFRRDVCNDLWISQFSIVVCARIWRDAVICSRMSRSLIFFVCFSSDEMFFHLIVISLSTCALLKNYTEVLTRCLRDDLYISQFLTSFLDSRLHVQILSRCLQNSYISQFAIVLAC